MTHSYASNIKQMSKSCCDQRVHLVLAGTAQPDDMYAKAVHDDVHAQHAARLDCLHCSTALTHGEQSKQGTVTKPGCTKHGFSMISPTLVVY